MTDRPPIIAHYPSGVLKAFCPCGTVIVRNPAVSSETETTCGLCARRYQWAEPARASGVDDTRKGASVPSPHRSDTATASTLEARADSWHRSFIVHRPRPRDQVVTLVDEPAPARERGANLGCNHGHSTKRMCVNCCRIRPAPKHEVLRAAIAGVQACWIWLCDDCLPLYQARGCIAQYARPNNWNVVSFKDDVA